MLVVLDLILVLVLLKLVDAAKIHQGVSQQWSERALTIQTAYLVGSLALS